MGIRGLNTIIKKYAPEAIQTNPVSKYRNTKVAIDCSILLYKFKYASRVENSHLIGIANRVKFYLMNGILPIFVFDGTPPDAKKITITKRQNVKEKMYVRLEELRAKEPETEEEEKEIQEEIDKLLSNLIVIKNMLRKAKNFLRKLESLIVRHQRMLKNTARSYKRMD